MKNMTLWKKKFVSVFSSANVLAYGSVPIPNFISKLHWIKGIRDHKPKARQY